MKTKKLTVKQEKFVLKYFECGNATEAYKYAYNTKRMSEKVIMNEASLLLNNRYVSVRLNELRAKAEAESQWNVKKVLDTYTRVIEIGLGNAESPHIVTEGQGKGETYTQSLNLKDTNLAAVNTALTNIAKHLGMFEKDNNQKTGIDLSALVEKVFKENKGK